jgi:formylglycine-generating enzyme
MAANLELGLDTFGDVTSGPDGNLLPHAQVIRDVAEEAVLADALGVDFFGVGEHHHPGFAVSSPEIVLAAIAARTKRIRLGSAVTVLSLAQYPVTRGEFAAFVRDTGHDPSGCYVEADGKVVVDEKWSWRTPGFEQTDGHPVVCASHDDAQLYSEWLRRKTGKFYRLPGEAEWEYAARAATPVMRYWGDERDEACAYANVGDLTGAGALGWKRDKSGFQCRDGYVHTAPVGSFRPNGFDLFDMLGNVQQWTGDCWHESYAGAPADGSAWTGGDCEHPVLRGGAWNSNPRNVRAARRNGYTPMADS